MLTSKLINGGFCTSTMALSVEQSIKTKLKSALDTLYLNVINESFMHNVPKGSETHFKVIVVSDKFNDLPLIKVHFCHYLMCPKLQVQRICIKYIIFQRHRLVNNILAEELQNGVHALSIVAKTPSQWQNSDQKIESSPNCMGGFGK